METSVVASGSKRSRRLGQSMAEYALILALLSIVAIVGLRFLGIQLLITYLIRIWLPLFLINLTH